MPRIEKSTVLAISRQQRLVAAIVADSQIEADRD